MIKVLQNLEKIHDKLSPIENKEMFDSLFGIEERPIFTKVRNSAPAYYSETSNVKNSLIADGCVIEGIVENSVLASGVKVARGAIIKDSVIMRNVTIGEGATINYSIIDSYTKIGAGSTIGHTKSSNSGIAVIGSDLEIAPASDIAGGEMVDAEWLEKNK